MPKKPTDKARVIAGIKKSTRLLSDEDFLDLFNALLEERRERSPGLADGRYTKGYSQAILDSVGVVLWKINQSVTAERIHALNSCIDEILRLESKN